MSETKIYPKGIAFFAPRENAPTWVKGSIIITPNDLFKWLKENESLLIESEKYGKQIKLQVTDKGLQVDTWKPTKDYKQPTERKTAADNVKKEVEQQLPANDDLDQLPF
jgi:hypothetical protein